MMLKLMIATFTLLSFLGCSSSQKIELKSVKYNRTGMSMNDCITINVKKTEETHIIEFEVGRYDENNRISFEIKQKDFDSLANIVMQMSKPNREQSFQVLDLMENFDVEFVKDGKTILRNYSINQYKNRKTAELQNQAVNLMEKLIDNYKKQFELRLSYSKGIATPTKICTYAEPADLVEDLGEYVEYSNPKHNEHSGGSKDYTYRWKALKPGKVTVWLREVGLDYDTNNLIKDFEPKGCYMIDDKLKVTFMKEDTDALIKKFRENNKNLQQ